MSRVALRFRNHAIFDVSVGTPFFQSPGSTATSSQPARKLVSWLTKRGHTARAVLEATGTYSLDVALALHRARGIDVMVANPGAVKNFAGALMQRSKTDLTAAIALREYAARMPFVGWVPPSVHVLHLRAMARPIAALVVERTRERNRLHALTATAEHLAVVTNRKLPLLVDSSRGDVPGPRRDPCESHAPPRDRWSAS